MHVIDSPAYYSRVVSYTREMFIKINHRCHSYIFFVTDAPFKAASVCTWQTFTGHSNVLEEGAY